MKRTFRRLNESHDADPKTIDRIVHVFREARRDRLQFLIDLHSVDEDREFVGRILLPNNQVWVAEAEDEIAGFIAFTEGWVNQLYIAPEFQRLGFGGALLAIAKQASSSLRLWVFQCNVPAIRFYEQHGFRIVEQTDGSANEARMPDFRMDWLTPCA